ncbi:SMR family transporter [Nonomuraea sp. NPDC050310]|uniref:DMT family transporter n=1 Tax=unclassified Nonomuraea TaxID=2593643 RepID=UPI003405A592
MKKWWLLSAAILLEVAATLSLRAALDNPVWFGIVAAGYAGAFVTIAFVLRLGMGVGVAYGIWAASGVALTAILSSILYGDALSTMTGVGIALVIGGVLCVELGSRAHPRLEGT